MATTTRTVTGSLPEVVTFIEHSVMAQSSSASMEAAVDLKTAGGGVSVRGYERYSWTGSNRVGMTVTSVQDGPYVHIAGVSLGDPAHCRLARATPAHQNRRRAAGTHPARTPRPLGSQTTGKIRPARQNPAQKLAR